ncbi:MAG: sigma 54-interacting transcriptional regulator [Kofleriaceae bacterium]
MQVSDLKLPELLDFAPEAGRITFRDHRMLLWDADAFGALRAELLEQVGPEAARGILMRFGFANGYRDALSSKDLFPWATAADWWRTCPAMQAHQGKVRPDVTALVVEPRDGRFELEVRWSDSYEASQHTRLLGPAADPVCWTLIGYASGFSTAVMGEEVFVIEQSCASAGHERCHVLGKTRRAWGAQGDALAAQYRAEIVTRHIDARVDEVRRARPIDRRDPRRASEEGLAGASSTAMQQLLALADKVAQVDATVLITGESGVGKERVASRLHQQSARRGAPFVAINCGALTETLLESELFGHLRGSFSGAIADRKGLFEAADGGTIFLDEIGETTAATQVKLLRVLQEREVRPIGSTSAIPFDVRIVAATNRDLAAMVEAGTFRQDLYYRLHVVHLHVPPLRERREDVLPLARWFAERTSKTYGVPVREISAATATLLAMHPWPGNVRELENAIEHAVALAGDALKLLPEHLPATLREDPAVDELTRLMQQPLTLEELERQYTLMVLARHQGCRADTARALKIGTNTLWRKLRRWGVSSEPR